MHARPEIPFLSCDWGTSSFRLRLVSSGMVLKEYSSNIGCKAIFDANAHAERAKAFEDELRKSILQLGQPASPLPLIISGMASSTIGWFELPYAELPLALDGSNLRVDQINWPAPACVARSYLVSGAASHNEMMRGEETEAIGLLRQLPSLPPNVILILPGTHCKHLRIESDSITAIRTFMTGELYAALSQHTVLRASVSQASKPDPETFLEAVRYVAEHGLAASIFQTRTRHVLRKQSPERCAAFLSGLLIGEELRALCLENGRVPICLGGVDSLRDLYAQAAQALKIPLAHIFSAAEVQQAVPRAHELILSRLLP